MSCVSLPFVRRRCFELRCSFQSESPNKNKLRSQRGIKLHCGCEWAGKPRTDASREKVNLEALFLLDSLGADSLLLVGSLCCSFFLLGRKVRHSCKHHGWNMLLVCKHLCETGYGFNAKRKKKPKHLLPLFPPNTFYCFICPPSARLMSWQITVSIIH